MSRSARSEPTPPEDGGSGGDARERTLRTAYRLFCLHGVQAVGVDRIIAEAGIAKATLYRHFRSKEELVIAVLQRREDLWSRGWLEQEINRRARTPMMRLLAIFDAFDEWFRRDDYESCLFVNTLLETHDRTSTIARASGAHLANVHTLIRDLAEEAGIHSPDDFAHQWQLLMLGSITAAATGDAEAAQRGRDLAALLLHREIPAES
jgi:AcrR family transcriptional regulator